MSARYPRMLCESCKLAATDRAGRVVRFFNEDLGGGFRAVYADSEAVYPSHECWVRGTKCWAEEAHMGGIVIQPGGEF